MNDNDTPTCTAYEDSDDDECEEYFLQATPGPYDIREKIRAANDELFEDFEAYNNAFREQRVTFREILVDYEPDYSSDDGYVQSPDVLSVLSENENDQIFEESIEHHELLYNSSTQEINHLNVNNDYDTLSPITNNSELNISQTITEASVFKEESHHVYLPTSFIEIVEENPEEIINIEEEVLSNQSDESDQNERNEKNMICVDINDFEEEEVLDEEEVVEIVEIIDDLPDDIDETNSNNTSPKSFSQISPLKEEQKKLDEEENEASKNKSKSIKVETINCRIHCLEKRDLDKITGVPKHPPEIAKGPVLKLRQRSCCTNQDLKPKLPTYNGFVSEYGMTKAQLERRQRRREKSAQRKKDKSVKISEEKKQKDLYNEEIFCAWLKSLKQREIDKCKKENEKNKNSSPVQVRQRPQTANNNIYSPNFGLKKQKNKRPSTSPCKGCSYNIVLESGCYKINSA